MPGQRRYFRPVTVGVLAVVSFVLVALFSTRMVFGRDSDNDNGQIARGAGDHHSRRDRSTALRSCDHHDSLSCITLWRGSSGELDCLALAAPEPGTGPGSGQFTGNAMYVAGKVTGTS